MNKIYVMLSGMPRSGSQVLSSILNQHPMIHSTTTSPIADLIGIISEQWPLISQSISDPYPDQLRNMLAGLLDGAYGHIDKPIIIDKNRLWPRYSELMKTIIGVRPKIICTVRDIPSILASYILLIEKNNHKITYIDRDLMGMNLPINNKNRCRVLWEKYISHPYTSLRVGVNSDYADLLFVEYDDIVNYPQVTIGKIFDFIGVDRYSIDTNNLKRMDENDDFHGGLDGLHEVRSILAKQSPNPEKVIGYEISNLYKNMKLEFWRYL